MEDSTEPQTSDQVCQFLPKPSRNKNLRKRQAGQAEDEDEDENAEKSYTVINKQKKTNTLVFVSGPSKLSTHDDSTNPKSNNTVFQYESSKEIQVQHDNKATATLETETDFSQDARAIRERQLKQAENSLKGKGKAKNSGGDKVYKGLHGYTDYKAGFRREHTISSEKAGGSHGPLRASAHIRVSARFDYQPDICKDYKETGYCGFGDACKFMHDRGDYKSGWQMEREWDEAEKVRKRNLAMGLINEEEEDAAEGDDDDENALPFACFICRQPFVDPVVTKCKHYFCEHCALKHHSKNKRCFVCNEPTLGIFNTAHELKKKATAAEGK